MKTIAILSIAVLLFVAFVLAPETGLGQELRFAMASSQNQDIRLFQHPSEFARMDFLWKGTEIPVIFNNEKFDFEDMLRNPVSSAGEGILGVISGYFAHEMAHQSAASSDNVPMIWNGSTWLAHSSDRKKMRNISSAGLEMQIVMSELLLNSPDVKKDAYALGWLWYNAYESMAYLRDGTSGEYNDLGTYGKFGGNVKVLEFAIAFDTLLSSYRVISGARPWFEVKATDGGMAVLKTFRFQ